MWLLGNAFFFWLNGKGPDWAFVCYKAGSRPTKAIASSTVSGEAGCGGGDVPRDFPRDHEKDVSWMEVAWLQDNASRVILYKRFGETAVIKSLLWNKQRLTVR
jgi:hypothetical protein